MRKVDPVHFFDSLGHSVLAQGHLQARVTELETENEELRMQLAMANGRLKALLGEENESAD